MDNDLVTRFNGYTISEGQLVSDRVQRIVMAIRDYSDELEVRWIPDRQADAEGIPKFKIVHCPPGQPEFVLFHVKSEDEFDETVLLRIIQNDQRYSKVTLSEYEAWEKAKKLVEKQVYLDQMEQAQDIAAHILSSPQNTYKVNNELTIKDGIPFNANKLNDPKFFSHSKKDK